MTNREAIAILEEARYQMENNQFIAFNWGELEALTLAINALQKEEDKYQNYTNIKSFW